ncbi:MAG TPA: histidinol dehydrogenase [Bryobacteraceae bacterium]|jgi:histidinol dehydrogenase|nr:histidinol dehydrogenase [Bryobacteraceae bacterium]
MLRILKSKDIGRLLRRRTARLTEAEETVRPILEAVRKQGDKGLLEYARKFDNLERKSVRVPVSDLAKAAKRLTPEFRSAVETAAENVRRFAEKQLPREYVASFGPGRKLGQVVRPLETVGAYIPAGRYPLPSTLIMTAVPAQVAGVKNICVACPKAVDEVYGTAHLLGVDQVFQMGGAQAIAAFAFGTRTVPRADRIVGPGNIYVAAAKKLLAGEVGIDFVAGPTEILIIAAEGDPAFLAADMLAQAEHDTDASAILLTTSKRLAERTAKEVERQLATLPTAAVARKAIDKNSAIVIVDSLDEAAELSNAFAPEHLSIHDTGVNSVDLIPKIRHAGSIFVGPFSPEAAGDYAAGPNHVLPTNGAARLRGGLSAADYVKVISIQQLDRRALAKLASSVTTLARAEGLEAHARSVEVRLAD